MSLPLLALDGNLTCTAFDFARRLGCCGAMKAFLSPLPRPGRFGVGGGLATSLGTGAFIPFPRNLERTDRLPFVESDGVDAEDDDDRDTASSGLRAVSSSTAPVKLWALCSMI